MGIQMLLKALGVNITPEQAAMVEALIPQIPAKLNQVVVSVNSSMENFDQRLKTLERQSEHIIFLLQQDLRQERLQIPDGTGIGILGNTTNIPDTNSRG